MAKSAKTSSKSKSKATEKSTRKSSPAAVSTKVTTRSAKRSFKWDFTPNALIAEFLGSMVLIASIIITNGNQFYIAISFIALAAVFMGISSVNFNPAVSFGLWAMRRMSAVRMAAYWIAQLLGAVAATLVLHLFSGEKFGLSLENFFQFDGKIFSLEAIGTAVFMLAFAAAWTKRENVMASAATMGLGLFIGLVVASGYLAQAAQGAGASANAQDTPRISKIATATLNPAAALVLTENQPQQQSMLGEQAEAPADKNVSRFTLETVLGTLLGAAVGGNLYLLLSSGRRESEL